VLVIDACPDNLLRLSFNVDFDHADGWARALLDGKDWRDAGLRYTSSIDILPFGRLTDAEWENCTSCINPWPVNDDITGAESTAALPMGAAGSAARLRRWRASFLNIATTRWRS
jgi:cellulose biosynthesis protein BcsQ